MINKPKVSIIIPTYNREKIIEETLLSAVNQDYDDYEIVITDNCSTDKTYDILKEYEKKHKNIRIYQNSKNLGPVRNWKKAIELAEGKYIKILWSDDQISEDFLSKTVPILENDCEIAFIYTKTLIYSDKEKNISYSRRKNGKLGIEEFIKGVIGTSEIVPVSPGCALFRKKDLLANLIINIPNAENPYGAGNDLLLFLLCYQKYKYFYYLDEVKSFFRAHSDSFTVSNKLDVFYKKAIIYFLNLNKKKLKLYRDQYFTLLYIKDRGLVKNEKFNFQFIYILQKIYIKLARIILN